MEIIVVELAERFTKRVHSAYKTLDAVKEAIKVCIAVKGDRITYESKDCILTNSQGLSFNKVCLFNG
jgi:hypothetical protein